MSGSKKYKVGVVADFPEQRAVPVEVGGFSVVICNYQGELYAVENRCSHDDAELCTAPVDGEALGEELDGCQITCPRHHAKFDVRDGTVAAPPARYPIDFYDVTVRGKSVFVEIDDE